MIMGYGTSRSSHAHHLSIVIVCVLVCVTQAVKYVWKAGLWTECNHHDCGPGGTRFRSVLCGEEGEYNFIEAPESNCKNLPKPKTTDNCFKVCTKHQNELRWAATVWSDCELDPAYRECSIRHGIRTRNVTCVWRKNGLVEDDSICSFFQTKPKTQEKCKLKCPQNCVVSYFSRWSHCDNCSLLNRTRTRKLVVPPANGGQPCPSFSEMIPCENCSETFTFQIGAWDPCSPLKNFSPHRHIGSQRRTIRCLNHQGSAVGIKNCLKHPQAPRTVLTDKQTCIIPQDCEVSDWFPMREINTSCIRKDGSRSPGFMVRERKVLQIPLGTGKPCPSLQHFFEVQASNEKPCQLARWLESSWSECEAPPHGFGCTAGLQTRKIFCIHETEDGREKPVPDEQCDPDQRPVTSQICKAECSLDCTVSHWTQWSECKVTNCELYLRRRRTDEGTGQRYRTRLILMEMSGDGEPCPHLSETQMCDPQPCYNWNMTLGKCLLLNPNSSPQCGLGKADRTIACVNKLGLRVSDSKCEELEVRPDSQEDCNIPCPLDCIVSPWSAWSSCPTLCQEGRSEAALRTRDRMILAQAGRGGTPCPQTHNLLDAQPCPTTIECAIYAWQVTRWGTCVAGACTKGAQMAVGVQNRDVNCYTKQHGQLVTDQRCTLAVKPATTRECHVPCPIDCKVTDYSDWSECSATCWDSRQRVPVKTRVRHIIQHSEHGGASCPNKLTEFKTCMNLTVCESQYWDIGPWSRCILPPDQIPHCGAGLRARDVTCRSENGSEQEVDVCIRKIGVIPPIAEPCHKACEEECAFEEWSQWSRCVNGCNGNRFRTRKLIDNHHNPANAQCRNHRLYRLDMNEPCLCEDHQPVPIGNWSECILESDSEYYQTHKATSLEEYVSVTRSPPRGEVAPGSRGSSAHSRHEVAVSRHFPAMGIHAVCGQGRRYKVLACQNDKGEVEAANQCSLKPYHEETCVIPCPVDCVMSEWSQWSDCSTSCGTGTQLRFRHIKQIPSYGGRQCPSLDNAGKETQTRVCRTDCRHYHWHTSNWSPCAPFRHDAVCGNGTQSRSVRCEEVPISGLAGNSVGNRHCPADKPRTERRCHAPCVGECVVSYWSDWSRCKQPCSDPNQVQSRTRIVLREPELNPRNNCPRLFDEVFCVRGDNCVEYTWVMSEWTSCLVNNGMEDCGTGHRERHPVCHNQHGHVIDNKKCVEALGENREEMVVSCRVPCDVDCLLTEWSPWSECSSSCGVGLRFHSWEKFVCGVAGDCISGKRSRTRRHVQEPIGNGRLCPSSHEQTKPCFEHGCYNWFVSEWSSCTGQVGLCGHGVQKRNITCMVTGGLAVNASNCAPDMDIIIKPTERPCTIPCPGECVLTDWSDWNDCFIDCRHYFPGRYSRGVRSRSRAVLAYAQLSSEPCSDQLWESEPCEAKRCFVFQWQASEWSLQGTRHVWCERSDGLLVTGGCSEASRPATSLSCVPTCSVDNSYCNDTNYCVCKDGYTSSFNSLDVLITCKKMANGTTDANVKTETHPEDGATNIWMYAVIAAGTLFVIFLAVACYTMSEFFHKGPRPRKKDEEKSVEGADHIDGMVEESASVSCNHSASRDVTASVTAVSDIDRISMISADRTPPSSVRVRALACGVNNVGNNKNVNDHNTTSMALFPNENVGKATKESEFGMHSVDHKNTSNDFTKAIGFCQNCDTPDCGGQHFRSFMHENDDLYDEGAGHISTLHANTAYSKSRCIVHDSSDCCGTKPCDSKSSVIGSSVTPSGTTITKADTSPVIKTTTFPEPKSSSTLNPKAQQMYSHVNKDNKVETKVLQGNSSFNADADRHSNEFGYNTGFPTGVVGADSQSGNYMIKNGEMISSIADSSVDTLDPEFEDSARQDHKGIVYINREASISENEQQYEVEDIKSSSLKNILKTYLNQIDQLATRDGEGAKQLEVDSAHAKDESTVENDTDAVFEEGVSEQGEDVPLLNDAKKVERQRASRPPLVNTKSQSLDIPPAQSVYRNVQKVSSLVYDSDGSVGRDQSLRSERSTLSRISHLSINRGPSVEIEPDETVVPSYTQNPMIKMRHPGDSSSLPAYKNARSGSAPRKKMNIGYITFSSVDTETSTGPSSSVSSESLSPRSLPLDLHDFQSESGQFCDKPKGNTLERSFKNVAMDSIKQGHRQKRASPVEVELDVDSGLGINIDSDKGGVHSSGIPQVKVRKPSKKNGASGRGRAHGRKPNGVNGHAQNPNSPGKGAALLTPMHFVTLSGETKKMSPNEFGNTDQSNV